MKVLPSMFRVSLSGLYVKLLLVSFATAYGDGTYSEKQEPSWMDNDPPQVRIEPVKKWHNRVFHIMLEANEASKLWISRGEITTMQRYKRPISITRDGVYKIYYYAEDDFGNRSDVDSMEYCLDRRSPQLSVSHKSGTYQTNTLLRLSSDEACRFGVISKADTILENLPAGTFMLDRNFRGRFIAIDSAGNQTSSEVMEYNINNVTFNLSIEPREGIYNVRKQVVISSTPGTEIFYTFDPLAPTEWFRKYTEPPVLPHGLSIVRYVGKNAAGAMSEIQKVSYVVDTIPPRLRTVVVKGERYDTLSIYCKEEAVIGYTIDGLIPDKQSKRYSTPIVIKREGVMTIKAIAWDRAENHSGIVTWTGRYDSIPPVITVFPPGGLYNQPIEISLIANEPAKILYSLNTKDNKIGNIYTPGCIALTRQGTVQLRYGGTDVSGNVSAEKTERYTIDTEPPDIKVSIEQVQGNNGYVVRLESLEKASISYSINSHTLNAGSPHYTAPVRLHEGDFLAYRGVDSAGNASTIAVVNNLEKPMAEAFPPAGLYNKKFKISFNRKGNGIVWWRFLPDTIFKVEEDTIVIGNDGMHTFEYYVQTENGSRSTVRRNVYFLDCHPPEILTEVIRSSNDSAFVVFNANENASIYYTIDGTNPVFSSTVKIAGNKLQQSVDRITLKKDPEMRLAFYAEDAAGNQSPFKVLDVFKPNVLAIPAGNNRIYDKELTINLKSEKGTTIHYVRNGKIPTTRSSVFDEPITLSVSDTIVAFAIDEYGNRGEPEKFIYLIDLPPEPQFSALPETLHAGGDVVFDAQETTDRETTFEKLLFRWDFDGNGDFDTDTGFIHKTRSIYKDPGIYSVVLEVTDGGKRKAVFRKKIVVQKECPNDMAPVFDETGYAFCIDEYEWPNRQGSKPLIGVSWIEAKMYCIDLGKRLCTEKEWFSVCMNGTASLYPYGDRYDDDRCVTKEIELLPSGSKAHCRQGKIADMVGNASEWVEDKHEDLTRAVGGSFDDGKNARCGKTVDGTIVTRSPKIGFRCCR